MDGLQLIGWVVAGGLVLYGLIRGNKFPKVPPRTTIAAARPGAFVRLVGKIVDGGSLVAPITGRGCVSFDAAITDGRGVPVRRGVRGTPFVIDDGTGTALVDPRGAFIRVVYDHSVVGGAFDRAAVADPDFVTDLVAGETLRFEEGVLTIGETIAVDGLIAGAGGDDPVYRRLAETGVRIGGAPDRPAMVSEQPADLTGE